MTFASPAWLLGLLLVPVIWYLHRSGPILRRQPVSNIDLWRGSRAAATESGARRRPDPAWIRRAAAAAAISLALAGPQLPRPAEHVTLWVDDSLSMKTVESGETRLQQGLQRVTRELAGAATNDVEIRTLGNPWKVRSGLDASSRLAIVSQAGVREPHLPDPRHLDRTRSQWLISDGADAKVNAWLREAGIARVVQVAAVSRNVGVAALTARPQPSDTREIAVQVRLVNGGTASETRRVEIALDGRPVAARDVSIDAGATSTLTFDAHLPAATITARLVPADALTDDDAAAVNISALEPVPVIADAACPAALLKAIRAHPGLRLADAGKSGLVVDCGSAPDADASIPRVRLVDGKNEPLDASSMLWAPAARRWADPPPNRLPPWTRGALHALQASDVVLLEASGAPLIVVRSGSPRVVETSLDLSSAEAAGDEALPLLVGLLADAALDEPLLGRSAGTTRNDDESRVASLQTLHASAAAGTQTRTSGPAFLLPLLALAIVLLAWDMLMLGRRLARDRLRPSRVTP